LVRNFTTWAEQSRRTLYYKYFLKTNINL
jgi:hypothetical protein